MKYRVEVTETATYAVVIDADSPEEAGTIGEQAIADAIVITKGSKVECVQVSEREVDAVTPERRRRSDKARA